MFLKLYSTKILDLSGKQKQHTQIQSSCKVYFGGLLELVKIAQGFLAMCPRHESINRASPPDDFNHATLVLLPKKPSMEVDGTKWFSPKDTRPISIVNADNRIIANVFRKVLAGFAERVCSKDQRGFLNNRFLLVNKVDTDFEARR